MLWHIMRHYTAHGHRHFLLALGYRGDVIKDYFLNYRHRQSDLVVNLVTGEVASTTEQAEDWVVRMVDTGVESMTGGRLRRLESYLRRDGTFMMTYGDGLADVDITKLVAFHQAHGKLATLTAVRPPARFGTMSFEDDRVAVFKEKPQAGEGWINGGFFVLEPGVFDYLHGDDTVWEGDPLERLAADGQLMAYRHEGFWHMMDTLRDKESLEAMWREDCAPWRTWRNQ